ncbi:MAG: NUDIX hydrolase [Paracoccaceae bacterium]
MRRYGEPVRPDITYTRRVGAYALIADGADLLLTLQDDPGPDLQLPGGGIDPGEGVLAALHREVREETGWKIAPVRRLGAYQRFTYMPEYDLWAHKICHIYLCRPVYRLGESTEDGHTALWMTAADAANLLNSPGDRAFASRFASGARSLG